MLILNASTTKGLLISAIPKILVLDEWMTLATI